MKKHYSCNTPLPRKIGLFNPEIQMHFNPEIQMHFNPFTFKCLVALKKNKSKEQKKFP